MPTTTLPNGTSLAYECFGKSDQEPVVLVSGAGAPAEFWPETFCAQLAKAGYLVVRYSHRDTGLSTHFDAPYGIDELLGDLCQLLDALRLDRVHLVGHSMGGYLVQLAMVEFPECLLSGTSISAGSVVTPELHQRLGTSTPEPSAWERLMSNQPVGDLSLDLEGWLESWRFLNGDRAFERTLAEVYTQALYRGDPRNAQVAVNHVHAMQTVPVSLVERLPECDLPLLVLHGSEDPLVPMDNGEAVARLAGRSTFERLDGAGHMFFERNLWNEISSRLLRHFRSTSTSE